MVELILMQDEQVIEALTSHTAQEALTDGIGTWGVIGGCEHLDATGLGNPREGHSKLAIVITDEVLRSLTKAVANLRCCAVPGVGRKSCHTNVDHSARVQFNNEEGEQ